MILKSVRDKMYLKKIQIAEQTDYIIESDKWWCIECIRFTSVTTGFHNETVA